MLRRVFSLSEFFFFGAEASGGNRYKKEKLIDMTTVY
jgi:hypothetical protein